MPEINKTYNIFSKLRANIEDFDDEGVYLVGKPSARDKFDAKNRGRYGGYYFSQRQVLEAIDLATASKFKEGNFDSNKRRKTFMNIVNFHKDVALNQINVNVSNYLLQPKNNDNVWPVYLMSEKFKEWATENSYDDTIDELANDFVGKGTCVVKRVKGNIERVPLRTLRNTQTAKSLEHAARTGGYVIIENEMTYSDMSKYKGWKLNGVDKTKPMIVFEQYGLIPKAKIIEFTGGTATDDDWDIYVLALQILAPKIDTFENKEKGNEDGHILYLQELKKFPLEEAHYSKVDGRWLGVGEVEKQLENQVARNLTANLRRRSLIWAAKRIFQSTDEDIATNLSMEVTDGEVVHIGKQGGELSAVNLQTQHLSDFQADENSWKENSQMISFSFETATGESLPSATPFRLGAILDAAVSKYFKRKQDTFSTFLKRSFFDQIIPTFKEENSDTHTLQYGVAHDFYPALKDGMTVVYANDLVHQEWMKGNYISYEDAVPIVTRELERSPYLFVTIPDDYYDNADCYLTLNINEPISGDVESLTTLYTSMVQQGDARAEKVLEQIFSLQGKNLASIIGAKQTPPPQQGTPAPSIPIKPDVPQPQPTQ